jgi:hypothetical protein
VKKEKNTSIFSEKRTCSYYTRYGLILKPSCKHIYIYITYERLTETTAPASHLSTTDIFLSNLVVTDTWPPHVYYDHNILNTSDGRTRILYLKKIFYIAGRNVI